MVERPFVHLHCHSHYSLLDGASRVPELIATVKQHGMNSCAITDHGNLFGAIEFYRECKDAGVNPVVGYEAYVAPGKRSEREAKRRGEAGFHLTLLAQNLTGFKNLIKMSSLAYTEGYHYIPRIDKDLLAGHSEGLICLSGCASSEFSEFILKEQMDEAKGLAVWFHKAFVNFTSTEQRPRHTMKRCADGAVDNREPASACRWWPRATPTIPRQDDALPTTCSSASQHGPAAQRRKPDEVRQQPVLHSAARRDVQTLPGFRRSSQTLAGNRRRRRSEDRLRPRHFPVFTPPEKKEAGKLPARKLCENRASSNATCQNAPSRSSGPLRKTLASYGSNTNTASFIRMGFAAATFSIVWDFVRFSGWRTAFPPGLAVRRAGRSLPNVLKLSGTLPARIRFALRSASSTRIAPSRPDIDIDFCQDNREKVIDYVRQKYGPRIGRPDRDLRHHGGEGGNQGRRSAGWTCRSRTVKQADRDGAEGSLTSRSKIRSSRVPI